MRRTNAFEYATYKIDVHRIPTTANAVLRMLRTEARRRHGLPVLPLYDTVADDSPSNATVKIEARGIALELHNPRSAQHSAIPAALEQTLSALLWEEPAPVEAVLSSGEWEPTSRDAKPAAPVRIAACIFCIARDPRRHAYPLATTSHTLALCPSVGHDIAALVLELHTIWKQHTLPGAVSNFVPWFSMDAAFDWASNADMRPDHDFDRPNINGGVPLLPDTRDEISAAVAPLIPQGDDATKQAFLRLAQSWRPIHADIAWSFDDGDRGHIPLKWQGIDSEHFAGRELFWRRAKTAFLAAKSRIWHRYRIARSLGNKLASAQEQRAIDMKESQGKITFYFQQNSGGSASPTPPIRRGNA